jgi:hypothetical protein
VVVKIASMAAALPSWTIPKSPASNSFRLTIPSPNVFHGNGTIAYFGPQPNHDPESIFVDFPHHPHLGSLLFKIGLVDAEGIDPEHARLASAP